MEVTISDKKIKSISKKDIEKYPVQRGPGGATSLAGGGGLQAGGGAPLTAVR